MQRAIRVATVATLAAIVTAPASAANSGGPNRTATSAIEGRWKTKPATIRELVAAGLSRKDAEALARRVHGTPAIDLRNGRFKGLTLETGRVVSTGTYRVTGNVVRFIISSGVGVHLGQPYWLRWNVYRDRLTFSDVPGRPALGVFALHPWTRVT